MPIQVFSSWKMSVGTVLFTSCRSDRVSYFNFSGDKHEQQSLDSDDERSRLKKSANEVRTESSIFRFHGRERANECESTEERRQTRKQSDQNCLGLIRQETKAR